MAEQEDELEFYGDEYIASKNKPVPVFLKLTYLVLPIWGIFAFYLYWNGSQGWLDRGYWRELQIAANTTFPIHNQNMPDQKNIKLDKQQEEKIQKDLE